jgi:hypothetical protein
VACRRLTGCRGVDLEIDDHVLAGAKRRRREAVDRAPGAHTGDEAGIANREGGRGGNGVRRLRRIAKIAIRRCLAGERVFSGHGSRDDARVEGGR